MRNGRSRFLAGGCEREDERCGKTCTVGEHDAVPGDGGGRQEVGAGYRRRQAAHALSSAAAGSSYGTMSRLRVRLVVTVPKASVTTLRDTVMVTKVRVDGAATTRTPIVPDVCPAATRSVG